MVVGWLGGQCLDLPFGTLHGVVGCPEQFENQISWLSEAVENTVFQGLVRLEPADVGANKEGPEAAEMELFAVAKPAGTVNMGDV